MWTFLRDILVVPALLWISPVSGGESARDQARGWVASDCDEEGQVTHSRHAARSATGDAAPALRRHAPALYP